MGLVRGRVGVDGRSLGDAPIPGVRSRSGDSGSSANGDGVSTRVDDAGVVEPTGAEGAFDDWAGEPYDDADAWADGAPVEDTWDEPAADGDAFPAEGEPGESAPVTGDVNGGTADDATSPTDGSTESAPENASDEPVAGERAPFGTWVRSVASRAAMGRLGVFFNPVARFRELSAKDAGGAAPASTVRASESSSRAAVRDGDAGDSEFDTEGELHPDVDDDAAEGELPPVGDEADGDMAGDIEGDSLDDSNEESTGEAEDTKGGASRAAAKHGSRSSGRGGRAVRAFVSACRRVLGVVLWPLSFVSRFVSRLVARPLSFVVRVLSRAPVVGRVVRLVSSAPRRIRRLLRTLVWAALLCGVLFVFGWRPPFVPVSSGVAGVDLPDSGHLSVSAWRVDDELVNVHVVNDGETVVESESVEVRASAWVPLSRLPWSLITRTSGGSCLADIDVVDVEDAADFVVSCPTMGGLGESVVPIGSSFGE